jgi:hypothetical protein
MIRGFLPDSSNSTLLGVLEKKEFEYIRPPSIRPVNSLTKGIVIKSHLLKRG